MAAQITGTSAEQSGGQDRVAPDFTLVTFDGETIRLSDLRGKVVVVTFWASWCSPCLLEIEQVQAASERYSGRDDVVFIGITYADSDRRSIEAIEEYSLTFPNGADVGIVIADAFGLMGAPETYIIDQNGHIVQMVYDFDADDLVAIIDQLIQQEE